MNKHGHVSTGTYANYFGMYTTAIKQAFGETEPSSSSTGVDGTDQHKNTGMNPRITDPSTETDELENTNDDEGTGTTSDDDGILGEIMNDFDEFSNSKGE